MLVELILVNSVYKVIRLFTVRHAVSVRSHGGRVGHVDDVIRGGRCTIYIVLLIYMMTADSIRALAQVRREHSGRHSSPIDPSLFYSSYYLHVLSQYEYIQQSI